MYTILDKDLLFKPETRSRFSCSGVCFFLKIWTFVLHHVVLFYSYRIKTRNTNFLNQGLFIFSLIIFTDSEEIEKFHTRF